jgi:hypothetical protein
VALFNIGSKRRTIQAFEKAQKMGTLNAEAYRYLGAVIAGPRIFKRRRIVSAPRLNRSQAIS